MTDIIDNTSDLDTSASSPELLEETLEGVASEMRLLVSLAAEATPAPLYVSAHQLEELDLFQTRNEIASVHVNDLVAGLEDGGDLTPVLVLRRGGRLFLIDGRHRKAAYIEAKRGNEVPVQEFVGTPAEAVLEGQRLNRQHTLRMSQDERMDAAWKLVKLDASGQCRYTLKAIMMSAGAGRGQVTLMRRVLRELGPRGHEYAQWKGALRFHKGQPQQVYSEDDMEAMWDAEARSGADKMVRAVGRRPADRPEVLARMIEYYSGRRIHAVIRVLQERNVLDEDDDSPF